MAEDGKMTAICVDCGKQSAKKVCQNCLLLRPSCANKKCTMKLPPYNDYEYCKKCVCSFSKCREPHTENDSECRLHQRCVVPDCRRLHKVDSRYCQTCIDTYTEKIKCIFCLKRGAIIPTKCCAKCDKKRKTCEKCQHNKVAMNMTTRKFAFYCLVCKCSVKDCFNPSITNGLCLPCSLSLCAKCHNAPPMENRSLCFHCARPKCSKPACNRFAYYNQEKKDFDAICLQCCRSPSCTYVRDVSRNFEYCKTCHVKYTAFGEVRCRADGCTLYTANENAICDDHNF